MIASLTNIIPSNSRGLDSLQNSMKSCQLVRSKTGCCIYPIIRSGIVPQGQKKKKALKVYS